MSVLNVRPSEWHSSASTGRIFMKFDIWTFFRKKNIERIQVALNSDINGYFTWRPMLIYDNMLLNTSYSVEKHFRHKLQRRSEHIFCSIRFFLSANRVVYDHMWQNTDAVSYGACAMHAGYLRLQRHAENK